MQKLVKAAKEGTKDGLEKTKAAVKKGRSFIKTKSFCNGGFHLANSVAAFRNISVLLKGPDQIKLTHVQHIDLQRNGSPVLSCFVLFTAIGLI